MKLILNTYKKNIEFSNFSKNLPRPPKPKSRAAIIEWFKRDELPRGTGFDPISKAVAPWFHGKFFSKIFHFIILKISTFTGIFSSFCSEIFFLNLCFQHSSTSKKYFFLKVNLSGIISRDQAENLLQDKPTGSFLVRVSERIWG